MKTAVSVFSMMVLCVTSVCAQWWSSDTKVKGDGNVVSKTRSISDYDKVSLKGSLDVALVYGEEGSIKIEAESNLIEHIVTKVEGNDLKIHVEKGYNLNPSNGRKLLITVPFKELSKVNVAGSGDINSYDTIKTNGFEINITGSGDVKLGLEAEDVKVLITGSGTAALTGNTNLLACNVTGSGDLYATKLKAKNVDASVTGSGNIKVDVTEFLKARVTGSGDIDYSGNPIKEDKKVAGSGDITSR